MALLPARDIQRETFHGEALLTAAQMIEPDQAEGEQARGIAFGRCADGRPGGLAAAQEGARIAGRETGLQIRLGADFSQRPVRELACEELAEALAENQALAAALKILAGGARQIHQKQAAFFAGEAFDHQFHAPARFARHAGDAPNQIAGLVPDLEGEARGAYLQVEIVRRERQQRLSGFEKRGAARGL